MPRTILTCNFSRFRQQSSAKTTPQPQTSPPLLPSMSNPRLLPLLLQAFIMTFVISLFFVFVGVPPSFFSISVLLEVLFFVIIVATTCKARANPSRGDEESSPGCSLEELKNLPKLRFRRSETCDICLDNILEGKICWILPNCNHAFHCNCIDKWLLKVPSCLICRTSVRSSNAEGKRMARIDWDRLVVGSL